MSVEAPLGATPQGGAFEITASANIGERSPRAQRRRSVTLAERVGLVAVTGVPLLGLLLSVAGTRTDQLVAQTLQPVPPWVAGPFYSFGFSLSTAEVITAVLLMLFGYLAAVRYAEHVPPRVVIAAIAALNLIVLLGPPLFSTDIFSYQAYAKMFAIYHLNPYVHGPYTISTDPIHWYIGARWFNTPSVYGPLFTFLSGAFASASVGFSEFAFKLIAAAACGGTLHLIWRSAQRRGVNPVRGIALFGLNPLVTVYGVGGGHNDLLMLLLTTAGVYAVLTRHERSAGGLITAGVAIKLTGAVVMPFALIAEFGEQRRRRGFLIGAAVVSVVIAGASAAFFGTGILHLLGTLQRVQDEGSWQSIPGALFAVAHVPVTTPIRIVFDLGLAGVLLWLLHRVWIGRMDWIEGAAWATFAILATAWALLPWYVSWLLPLVALCRGRRLSIMVTLMTLVAGAMMVADCVPHGFN